MHKSQFTDAQIVAILVILLLQQAEKGEQTIAEVCRQHNIAENTFYRWRNRFGGRQACRLADMARSSACRPPFSRGSGTRTDSTRTNRCRRQISRLINQNTHFARGT
jgi:putative transposase